MSDDDIDERDKRDQLAPLTLPRHWNRMFWTAMSSFGLFYVAAIVGMLIADLQFTDWADIKSLIGDPNVRYSIWLSLITCTISAVLSVWIAIPTGYLLARASRDSIERRWDRGTLRWRLAIFARHVVDTILDIPIVLPPLVIGISLLVLFQTSPGRMIDQWAGDLFSLIGYPEIQGITYEVPAVIVAQTMVAAAFATRTMRNTFEQIDDRPERMASTLGASRFRVFADIALPQSWRGIVAALTLAWSRSLGEFGPILIFAGTSRMKTEVLSTTVYLNFQIGNLRGAIAASIILVTLAMVVLIATRVLTLGGSANGSQE